MKSYRQHCGVARALDVVGDRWTLLIVRELLVLERARYSDLVKGLPGVATNLLADRLREMEAAGLVERIELAPPAPATVIQLTPRGRELEAVIAALGRWASPLLAETRRGDAVRGHWYALPARLYLRDRSPNRRPITIQLEFADEPVILTTPGDGTVDARLGRAESPDATLTGTPGTIMGLLAGSLTVGQARARGLRIQGRLDALERVRPERSSFDSATRASQSAK